MMASAIRHLAVAERAPRIAAGLVEHTVQLWHLQTGERLSQLNTVLAIGGRRLSLSPSGDLLITAAWTKGKKGGLACYDAVSGSIVWHRTDIRHAQCVRFSRSGDTVFCGLEEGPLQVLNASTGETLEGHSGVYDIIECRYSDDKLFIKRGGELMIRGKREFRISRLSFALLDAVFSPEALCLSEAGGPVRCLDCTAGQERWRYQPPADAHVLRLAYRSADGHYYGVEREYQRGTSRTLVRLIGATGKREQVCRLNSWDEEFGPTGDAVVNSNGEVIEVATGNTIKRLAFPQAEYP